MDGSGGGEWFKTFFDEIYYETYRPFEPEERNEREARFIAEALSLPPGGRVLDLGCGYARHAAYLALWGYRVTCLDLSRSLLERARERLREFGVEGRAEIVEADMRSIEYDGEFDGVYMFFTTFGYFSDGENREVLRRAARALKPEGSLLVDTLNVFRVACDHAAAGGSRRTWYEAGGYTVLEESAFNPETGRLEARRLYYRDGRLAADRRFTLRLYPYWELASMLGDAGLRVAAVYGNTRRDAYTLQSPRMIVVASKDGEAAGSRRA